MPIAQRLREAINDRLRHARPPTHEDMGAEFHRLRERATPYTMTSTERLFALYEAVRYIVQGEVPGDFVECGVWRGGSSMMAAMTLRELGQERTMWLYDTFEGMPEPGTYDAEWTGTSAADVLAAAPPRTGAWAYATLKDVQANMATVGYPVDRIHYVQGKVEETIPAQAPDTIALLRLDTDWYDSTRHELEHLWDRLSPRGVLIIDDYGHWSGARKAVDEFFARQPFRPLMSRIDYTGRMLVKP